MVLNIAVRPGAACTWASAGLLALAMAGCGGGGVDSSGGGGTRLLATTAAASTFGATVSGGLIKVDTGAGLVFKVKQSGGDISSIRYHGGAELQQQDKGSHIASGLGSATAVSYTVQSGIIKITLTTSTLTHYLLVREGENIIYMGTYTTAEPSVGELRWITRLNASTLTSMPGPSNNAGTTGAIESQDVFGLPNGETRSKYYGNQRAIDLSLRGVGGNGFAIYMVYGNRETSSGGPFYNDIQNQSAEVYNYMNSGHNQTEAWRMGFHGPYALVFTDGEQPGIPDMSWMESQNLLGWVPASQRGRAVGSALTGMYPSYPYTVAFSNATAQYWAKADPATGAWITPPMIAGDYTMKIFKGEFQVDTATVTVTAGGTTEVGVRSVSNDPSNAAALWRIGDWDGTPNEFLNASRLRNMHPSDVRHSPWVLPEYVVGTSVPATDFSPYQWKGVNGNVTIKFKLKASQIKPLTLRAGITVAQAGARPRVMVNGWQSAIPSPSNQPDSRSITLGSFRGNNKMYTYNIPASELVVGINTLVLSAVSGSGGSAYLSPAYAYDAVDLIPTP